jgi:hypothetical protein
LALFGRRLPRRVEAPVIPASENQHNCGLMQRNRRNRGSIASV